MSTNDRNPRGRIRVMIVEDSRPVREMLEYIIGNDPRLEVAESVSSAEEALRMLHQRLSGCDFDGYPAARHEWF